MTEHIIPVREPERQMYFIEQVKSLVEQRTKEQGRPLTCCIQTFGCRIV